MNSEKEKYANGNSIDASKMSRDEKRQAIKYWCEGNSQLKTLLSYFNEKNIETIGCCSGHEKSSSNPTGNNAYMAVVLNSKQNDLILDLLAMTEERNIDMEIAFRRGTSQKKFCILCSKTIGFNESFFGQLNEICFQLAQGIQVNDSIKKKYKMLEQLLTDERIIEKTNLNETEYSFSIGEEVIRTSGFLGYGNKIIDIPVEEIERMGEWLYSNPGLQIPSDFCGEKITKITYPLHYLKEKAKVSKLPLKLINEAYEWIKNAIRREKVTNKNQEESARS